MSDDKKISLSPDHLARMATLREEVIDRLEEMSRIVAQTLGYKGGQLLEIKFTPRQEQAQEVSLQANDKLICFVTADDQCGCYDFEEGVCYPC